MASDIESWAVPGSDVEQEVHQVTVLDDVVLALGAHLSGILGTLLTTALDEVLVGDDLGPDKAFLEVRVDDSGGLGGRIALVDGPGPHFLHPGGEVGLEAQ